MLHHLVYPSERTVKNKQHIGADDMLLDAFRLAATVFESGFRPDWLVGLWRGGSAVGIAVQEGLEYFGVATDHIAVRTSYEGPASYSEQRQRRTRIGVHGLQYILDRCEAGESMLIVDDVYSTGNSVAAVIRKLRRRARFNTPHDIRIATIWFRPSEKTRKSPDYFIHETADWLVLPYEIAGMTPDEIRKVKPRLASLLDELEPQAASEA